MTEMQIPSDRQLVKAEQLRQSSTLRKARNKTSPQERDLRHARLYCNPHVHHPIDPDPQEQEHFKGTGENFGNWRFGSLDQNQ